MASCENNGHMYGSDKKCIFCGHDVLDVVTVTCSECGELRSNVVPHTCYSDYEDIKGALRRLVAFIDYQHQCGRISVAEMYLSEDLKNARRFVDSPASGSGDANG